MQIATPSTLAPPTLFQFLRDRKILLHHFRLFDITHSCSKNTQTSRLPENNTAEREEEEKKKKMQNKSAFTLPITLGFGPEYISPIKPNLRI